MISNTVLTVLIKIINDLGLKCKVQSIHSGQSEKWSTFVTSPADGYIETSESGPVPLRDVEFIEINPLKETYLGKLLQNKKTDLQNRLIELLQESSIEYQRIGNNIKVKCNFKNL